MQSESRSPVETDRRGGQPPRYRASALDRSLAQSRIVAVVGPVADLRPDLISAKLYEAARISDSSRIALVPGGGPQWPYHGDDWKAVVEQRPDLASADLGQMVTAVRSRPGERQPIEVVLCGDYLVLDYAHGLGDGRLGLALLAVLAGGGAAEARQLGTGLVSDALDKALRRHFGSQPGRVLDMLRIRKRNKLSGPANEAEPRRRISDWQQHRQTVTAHLPADEFARLRAWAKDRFPESSRAALTIALLMAALRSEGRRVDDQVSVLVDCRRYLDPADQNGFGNFAVAVPILMPPDPTPDDVVHRVRAVTESGWPLAVLAVAEVKARLRRGSGPAPEAGHVEVPDRIRLSLSDLGKLTLFEHLDWTGQAPAQVTAFIEPDGADAVTVLVDEMAGGCTLAASFCDQMIDPAVIRRAFGRICTDPVGVLGEIGGRR